MRARKERDGLLPLVEHLFCPGCNATFFFKSVDTHIFIDVVIIT